MEKKYKKKTKVLQNLRNQLNTVCQFLVLRDKYIYIYI